MEIESRGVFWRGRFLCAERGIVCGSLSPSAFSKTDGFEKAPMEHPIIIRGNKEANKRWSGERGFPPPLNPSPMYLRSVEIIAPFFNQIEYQKVLIVRDTLPINDLLQNQTTPRSPNNQRPNPLYRDPRTRARKSRRRPRRH